MISIDIKGDQAAQIALERAPSVMLRSIRQGLHRSAQELARAEKMAAPKAFSHLTNSMQVTQRDALSFQVAPAVHYASAVEFGTDPGVMPSVQSILAWMHIKHIESDHDGISDRDMAFFIARGIRDHGIKANPFFFPTADKMTPRIHDLMRESINHGITQALQ